MPREIHGRSTLLLAALACVFALAACSDDPEGGMGNEGDDPPGPDLTDPAVVVELHRAAWEARSLDALSDVLAPDFQFYPLAEDLPSFPWLGGDSWGRSDELAMAGNMFNASYSGGTARPVMEINMEHRPRGPHTVEGGVVRMSVDFDIIVRFDTTDAFRSSGVFVFELVADAVGDLSIRGVREQPPLSPRSLEDESWGSIKELYR